MRGRRRRGRTAGTHRQRDDRRTAQLSSAVAAAAGGFRESDADRAVPARLRFPEAADQALEHCHEEFGDSSDALKQTFGVRVRTVGPARRTVMSIPVLTQVYDEVRRL